MAGVEIDPTAPPYNAKFDWAGGYGSIAASSNLLTILGRAITSADFGKQAIIKGAGRAGASLYGWITGATAEGQAILTADIAGTTPADAAVTVSTKPCAYGSDDTTAINAALAAAVAPNGPGRVQLPAGWARFSQLVIPTGCKIRSAGWGSRWGVTAGPQFGPPGGTLLQQLEGETVDAVIFTAASASETVAYVGPVDVDLGTVEGPYVTAGAQNGINCSTATMPGRPQDGFRLHDTQIIGFPGDAFRFPSGAVPLQGFTNNRAFYNGGYGVRLIDSSAGALQMAAVENFSGDCNSLGLIYVSGVQHPTNSGLVKLVGVKSEANSFSQQNLAADSHEWTPPNDVGQLDCIVLDSCQGHVIVEADHISAARNLAVDPSGGTYFAPGPVITIQGSVAPTVRWDCSVRSFATDTNQSGCVMLNDVVKAVTVPRTVKSGFYGSANAASYGG